MEAAGELDRFAERAVATMQVPPGELRMFGKPRWQRNAQWFAVRLGPFFALGLFVIPALWVWDRRRRRQSRGRTPIERELS
jgi:hypothetical protein